MIKIIDKAKCCGCTSCASACPQMAISMLPDEEGFMYPKISTTLCVDCGLCETVCPILNGYHKELVKKAYVVRAKEESILKDSTSGGAFTILVQEILQNNGVVFGVAFDEKFKVKHSWIDGQLEELGGFRGSKYVQSSIGETFNKVKEFLDCRKQVLFSGTPCQIAGLNNYLRKEYENLLTVEVVCHGVTSPKLWDKYLEYQTAIYKSDPKKIKFRNKTYGYHSGTMEIVFENGLTYHGSARVDLMLKSFFSEIASRPSCYFCVMRGRERAADISIFDAWHAGKLSEEIKDDDKGYTNLLINSKKGRHFMEKVMSKCIIHEISADLAIRLDGSMICQQPHMHERRFEFYREVNTSGIKSAIEKYIPISKRDVAIEHFKRALYKTGLLNAMKIIVKGDK